MSEYEYGKVTQEIIDRLNEIAPKRVYTGDEINDDFTRIVLQNICKLFFFISNHQHIAPLNHGLKVICNKML